ncbi:MAG: response regulator transcription factor [Clostridia bacterium]|nr:response regulator transcription factor [Clostridia bacterium]
MYKVLIVDDEQAIRELVAKYCALEGFSYGEAGDGLEAIQKVKEGSYDIVVMDVMMPELDGFSAVREIRKFSSLPIIMLSARTETYDKIHGFEIGADDYIGKPFSPKELMLRISAVMNRVKSQRSNSEVYENELLKVDFTARIVCVEWEEIDLSPKEYELLFFMVKNRGIALSREKLLNEVWGYDFYGDDRTLDTHIKLLRKSLGSASQYVVTLRGMGYRFDG